MGRISQVLFRGKAEIVEVIATRSNRPGENVGMFYWQDLPGQGKVLSSGWRKVVKMAAVQDRNVTNHQNEDKQSFLFVYFVIYL